MEALAALAIATTQEKPVAKAKTPSRVSAAVNAPLDPVTESTVRTYFADAPIMIEVARCESRFRHYDANGDVMRGIVNALDRGVMQINEHYHLETATKLGYDIHTLEGNLAYARHLYETQGTRPWISSSPCWGASADASIAQK